MLFPEDVKIDRKKDNKRAAMVIATSCTEGVYNGLVQEETLVQNYLVIRNKRTKTARLLPYNTCSLISDHYSEVPPTAFTSERDQQALRNSLAKYGGKNAMRAHDRINRMKMNIDVIKDQLDQTISMSTEQMKIEHMEEERLLDGQDEGVEPSKNYDAKTVQELYNFTDLLSPDLVQELDEIAVEVLETKPGDVA